MNEELCYKYLNFVTVEVDRYLLDRRVTDDELIDFATEIENFKEKVKSSNLNNELKKRVDELTYKYTRKQLKRSGILSFIWWVGLSWTISFLIDRKKQEDRKSDLLMLRSQASTLMMYMKMNY